MSNALVAIDQREFAEAILRNGANNLPALKNNRPTLVKDARLFFIRDPAKRFDTRETTDGDHDRIEVCGTTSAMTSRGLRPIAASPLSP